MQEIHLHSSRITQALVHATISPLFIYEFLQVQTAVLKEINSFNKTASKDIFIRNEIKITQASILKELLDLNDDLTSYGYMKTVASASAEHRNEVLLALREAGLDMPILYDFFETQLEVYREFNWRNKDRLSSEYSANILRIEHVAVLTNLLKSSQSAP